MFEDLLLHPNTHPKIRRLQLNSEAKSLKASRATKPRDHSTVTSRSLPRLKTLHFEDVLLHPRLPCATPFANSATGNSGHQIKSLTTAPESS